MIHSYSTLLGCSPPFFRSLKIILYWEIYILESTYWRKPPWICHSGEEIGFCHSPSFQHCLAFQKYFFEPRGCDLRSPRLPLVPATQQVCHLQSSGWTLWFLEVLITLFIVWWRMGCSGVIWPFGLERKSLPLAVYLAPCLESQGTRVGGAEHNRVGAWQAFPSQLFLALSVWPLSHFRTDMTFPTYKLRVGPHQ